MTVTESSLSLKHKTQKKNKKKTKIYNNNNNNKRCKLLRGQRSWVTCATFDGRTVNSGAPRRCRVVAKNRRYDGAERKGGRAWVDPSPLFCTTRQRCQFLRFRCGAAYQAVACFSPYAAGFACGHSRPPGPRLPLRVGGAPSSKHALHWSPVVTSPRLKSKASTKHPEASWSILKPNSSVPWPSWPAVTSALKPARPKRSQRQQ